VLDNPRKVLLVATRQIGDVLLATPLLKSMRRAWPEAVIDVLVYKNKGQMLEGNCDCNHVIEVPEHPTIPEYIDLLPGLYRKYDLAVNTLAGDRPHLFSLWSSKSRIGLIADKGRLWKGIVNTKLVPLDNVSTHTVIQNLKLADCLGIERSYQVTPPRNMVAMDLLSRLLPNKVLEGRFAIIHPLPMWRYKQLGVDSWKALSRDLLARVDHVVITGGDRADEKLWARQISEYDQSRIISLVGKVSFALTAALLKKASIYIGPDTAMTHLASACGVKTIAVYGPSNPVKWGPWPKNWSRELLWKRLERPYQQRGNVFLVQGTLPEGSDQDCIPCGEEGCFKHKGSVSACLENLKADDLRQLIDKALID